MLVHISKIVRPTSPRIDFALPILVNAIISDGLQDPIQLLEQHHPMTDANPNFELILVDGERRIRAYEMLGWNKIPATVVERKFDEGCFGPAE